MDTTNFVEDGPTRKSGYGQKVYVTPEEREAIHAIAQRCGLSVSAYMRNLALGYVPTSAVDSEQVRNLMAVNADQTRLGNLLKMWLTERNRYNDTQMMSVTRLLEKIEDAQRCLRIAVDEVLKRVQRENDN
jgi:hypothetical protein